MTMGIKYFYFEYPMPEYKYFCIPVRHVPKSIMKQYQFREKDLIHNGFALSKIHQGMYWLPQAGILVNKHLIKHPSKY